jgi:myo-inositol-1(or 4)-monophosphatase
MNPWDSLAGLLMIREAGGVTYPFPARQTLGLTLAASPGIWDDLHRIAADELGDLGPGGRSEA